MNSRPPRPGAPKAPVTPMHRGPQAAFTSGNIALHAPNAALLIDFDNVTMGIQKDLHAELRNLLSSDIIKGKVAVQRAYADWRRYPQYIVPLAESSIDMIMAPAYGSSKKNATDIRLAIDALELVFTRPEIGTYILLSGDSDFSSLVIKLKEYGKYVIGVGIRESSSDLLVMNCDEYYSWNSLTGLVRSDEDDPSRTQDPWQLVTEAVLRMKRNGDVMRSDRLKQVMHDIDPNFDEKDLGFSKFSRFCQEAQLKGLLSVTKLENGQLEIDAPSKAVAASAAPAASGAVEPVLTRDDRSDERPRRGRRGGRGRGREREGRDELPIGEGARTQPPAQLELSEEPAPLPRPAPRPAPSRPDSSRAEPPRTDAPRADASRAEAPRAEGQRPEPRRAPAARAAEQDGAIGVSGERLTRDEAFSLVKRAVEALTTGDDAVRASAVRARARELLGRDSESLSERNFSRILRDAHDADRIDLRRRGDDFEVARAAEAPPVAEQLARAERAATPAAPAAAPAPRTGMGHRGAPSRGGRARPAVPLPPELLSIGIVPVAGAGIVSKAGTAAPASDASGAPDEADDKPSAAKRGKAPAKKAAGKRATKAPAKKAAAGRTAPAKAASKGAAKQAASKSAAKTSGKQPAAKRPRGGGRKTTGGES